MTLTFHIGRTPWGDVVMVFHLNWRGSKHTGLIRLW